MVEDFEALALAGRESFFLVVDAVHVWNARKGQLSNLVNIYRLIIQQLDQLDGFVSFDNEHSFLVARAKETADR